MNMYKFEEEETWRLARELAWEIYGITSRGAFESDQPMRMSLRRASFAIMGNVAEGIERGGTLEFIRFLSRAKDVVKDLVKELQLAKQKNLISDNTLSHLVTTLESLGCMISGLMTSINQEFINADSVSVSYQGF